MENQEWGGLAVKSLDDIRSNINKILQRQKSLAESLIVIASSQLDIKQNLKDLVSEERETNRRLSGLRKLIFSQFKPKNVKLTLISERVVNMASILKYSAELPVVPTDSDVEGQTLEVSVGGVPVAQDLPADAVVAEFEVPQDAEVTVSLKYFDDAGNYSDVTSTTFVAVDTIGPEAPGEFGAITLVGERQVEDEVVEPETPVVPSEGEPEQPV